MNQISPQEVDKRRIHYLHRSVLWFFAFFSIAAFINGCSISISRSHSEVSKTNYPKIGKEVMAHADEQSQILESKYEILPDDHRLTMEVREALAPILEIGGDDTAEIGGGFLDDYGSFTYFNEDWIQVRILARDDPYAVTYPNGKMYLSMGLVDGSFPYAAKNHAQLTGVLAHEFIHFRRGDLFNQWVLLDARGREVVNSITSGITKIIPGIEYDYSGGNYDDVLDSERRIEFEADMFVLAVLNEFQLGGEEYASLLRTVSSYAEINGQKNDDSTGWISDRAACMNQRFFPSDIYVNAWIDLEESREEKIIKFDAAEQYSLCYLGTELKGRDKERFLAWLKEPDGEAAEDFISTLPESSQEKLGQYIYGVVWDKF